MIGTVETTGTKTEATETAKMTGETGTVGIIGDAMRGNQDMTMNGMAHVVENGLAKLPVHLLKNDKFLPHDPILMQTMLKTPSQTRP